MYQAISKFQSAKIITLIVVLIFLGCKTELSLHGKYKPVVSMSPNGLTLEIKSDRTFSMLGWSDILGQEVINGTWKYSDKKLWLIKDSLKNDAPQTRDSLINVVERFDKISSKIIVRVIDAQDKKPVVGMEIGLNEDQSRFITDTSGTVIVDAISDLDKLRFSYLQIHKSIRLLNPKTNDITLVINFANLPHLSWLTVPELWKVKGNKLIPIKAENVFVFSKILKK